MPENKFRSLKTEILRVSKLNLHKSENLPLPLFAKEGQGEVRRDFINNVVSIMRLLIS